MGLKKIIFALIVTSLLIGGACAASVNDFKMDDTYKSLYKGEYYSVYANNDKDCGISIYIKFYKLCLVFIVEHWKCH